MALCSVGQPLWMLLLPLTRWKIGSTSTRLQCNGRWALQRRMSCAQHGSTASVGSTLCTLLILYTLPLCRSFTLCTLLNADPLHSASLLYWWPLLLQPALAGGSVNVEVQAFATALHSAHFMGSPKSVAIFHLLHFEACC